MLEKLIKYKFFKYSNEILQEKVQMTKILQDKKKKKMGPIVELVTNFGWDKNLN